MFCEPLRNVVSFAIFGGPFTRLRRRVLAQEASFRFTLVRVPQMRPTEGSSECQIGESNGVFECFGRFFCKFRQFNFQHEVGMERNCRYQVEVLSVGGDTLLMI